MLEDFRLVEFFARRKPDVLLFSETHYDLEKMVSVAVFGNIQRPREDLFLAVFLVAATYKSLQKEFLTDIEAVLDAHKIVIMGGDLNCKHAYGIIYG